MIAVSETSVAVAASVLFATLLTVLVYLFVRIARSMTFDLGGIVSSRWLMWIGVVISVAGLVALIWTQAQSPFGGSPAYSGAYWWQIAMGPLSVIGIGALVIVAARIMGMMQGALPRPSD